MKLLIKASPPLALTYIWWPALLTGGANLRDKLLGQFRGSAFFAHPLFSFLMDSGNFGGGKRGIWRRKLASGDRLALTSSGAWKSLLIVCSLPILSSFSPLHRHRKQLGVLCKKQALEKCKQKNVRTLLFSSKNFDGFLCVLAGAKLFKIA